MLAGRVVSVSLTMAVDIELTMLMKMWLVEKADKMRLLFGCSSSLLLPLVFSFFIFIKLLWCYSVGDSSTMILWRSSSSVRREQTNFINILITVKVLCTFPSLWLFRIFLSLFMFKLLRQSFLFLLFKFRKFPWLKSHSANFFVHQEDSSENFCIYHD